MYSDFRELLVDATGQSELVIVANADVRGFSKFSLERESVEAALFVKKVYAAMLSDYFDYADFFKPTGDGLLLVFRVEEATLEECANKVVRDSIRLVDDFPALLTEDKIINFPVPDRLGVGLARGAASRLVSGNKTLDYSGKVLNLASRLMDFARPAGVVFDSSFGIDLLDDPLAEQFETDEIFVRSVAEAKPIKIHYTAEHTTISVTARRPLNESQWEENERQFTFRELRQITTTQFQFQLEQRPLDPAQINAYLWAPALTRNRRRHRSNLEATAVGFVYEEEAGRPLISWNAMALAATLAKKGAKDNWPLRLIVTYPV